MKLYAARWSDASFSVALPQAVAGVLATFKLTESGEIALEEIDDRGDLRLERRRRLDAPREPVLGGPRPRPRRTRQAPQAVQERLGERFLPWRLSQSVEESWAECDRHARNILGEEGFARLQDWPANKDLVRMSQNKHQLIFPHGFQQTPRKSCSLTSKTRPRISRERTDAAKFFLANDFRDQLQEA